MSLSAVAQELLWLYLAQPDFVGSVRDFSAFLSRSAEEILAAVDEVEPLGCLGLDRDEARVSASAVVFQTIDPSRRQALYELLAAGCRAPLSARQRPAFGYSGDLIGRDRRMLDVYAMIDRVSRTNATVLVLGESGVGKEVVARAIHAESLRAQQAFAVIDCASIPPALIESALFGHERGSFTSALRRQMGRLEEADGGTVFLDEIAELSVDLQAKLLRVLQTRQFTRVGGTTPITIDVRFVAATNRAILDMVRARTFREDLYYRLNVVSITVPPLRERGGDVPLLAQRILASVAQRNGIPVRGLGPEALEKLGAHHWPGNVRELENVLERAMIVARGPVIAAGDIALAEPAPAGPAPPRRLKTLRQAEIDHIRAALAATGGNESQAARILGIHRDTLYRKIRRYRIVVGAQITTPDLS